MEKPALGRRPLPPLGGGVTECWGSRSWSLVVVWGRSSRRMLGSAVVAGLLVLELKLRRSMRRAQIVGRGVGGVQSAAPPCL